MPKTKYGQLEQHIIKMFKTDKSFSFKEKIYKVDEKLVGKPITQGGGGECKTDVFVRGIEQNSGEIMDLKISVKKNLIRLYCFMPQESIPHVRILLLLDGNLKLQIVREH